MNKIKIVNNDIIPFINDDVIICDNNITFSNSGNYYIDYVNSNNIKLVINICDNKCIHLFEYSNNKDISFNKTYLLLKKNYYLSYMLY